MVSVTLNPGALDSDFWRTQGKVALSLLRSTVLHPPIYGAYTALFAAFSPEVSLENPVNYGTYPFAANLASIGLPV